MARAGWPGRRVALFLALLSLGCGGEGPSPLRLSVEVSDDTFCPGGRLRGIAEPETIEVRVGLRARGRAVLELERQAIDLKVYRDDDHSKVVQRRRLHVSMKVGETWKRPQEPIAVSPPEVEGRYVLEVSTEDGAWSSTPLEVWYDAEACPRPGPAPSPGVATPVASPRSTAPAEPVETRRTALRAGLRALWRCNAEEGVEDLEVRVRVHNPESSGRAERGVQPRLEGVDEIDAFETVAGDLQEGYLPAGSSLEFRAFGWIEVGAQPVSIHVSGERSPIATGLLQVDCSGGAGAEGTGTVGAWTP